MGNFLSLPLLRCPFAPLPRPPGSELYARPSASASILRLLDRSIQLIVSEFLSNRSYPVWVLVFLQPRRHLPEYQRPHSKIFAEIIAFSTRRTMFEKKCTRKTLVSSASKTGAVPRNRRLGCSGACSTSSLTRPSSSIHSLLRHQSPLNLRPSVLTARRSLLIMSGVAAPFTFNPTRPTSAFSVRSVPPNLMNSVFKFSTSTGLNHLQLTSLTASNNV